MKSLILQFTGRALLVVLVVFSIFLLLRGHDEPGGGFVGGLLAAAAFGLYALAFDPVAARRLLRVQPLTLLGAGLTVMAASGILALLRGQAFMAGQWADFSLPGFGKPGTPVLFDIGVYLAVCGAGLLILLNLVEEH